jgi:TldD protein
MEVEQLFKKFQNKGAEYIDLRTTMGSTERIILENNNPSVSLSTYSLYGVRVFYKGAWGFSSGVDLGKLEGSFEKAFNHAVKISSSIEKPLRLDNMSSNKGSFKAPCKTAASSVELQKKLDDVSYLDSLLKENKDVNNRIVMMRLSDYTKTFMNSSGADITESFSLAKMIAQIYQNVKNVPVMGMTNHGGSYGYDLYTLSNLLKFSKEAFEDLAHQAKAEMAPAGTMPIIMDGDLTGVFFHEAVGHACEADHLLEDISVLKGKLNQKVAPDFINLRDSPNIPNENGFFRYDDEGMPGGNTILIKDGILKGYMHSLETASRLGMKPTGNGRAQDPFSLPIPRMTNTILEKGDNSIDELFAEVKHGIYAQSSAGGVVTPHDGAFLFNTRRAFLIEDGKKTKLLKGVSFGGNILQTLQNIKMVCKDVHPIGTGGMCGKESQNVPVGEQTPSILVSEVTVGGS